MISSNGNELSFREDNPFHKGRFMPEQWPLAHETAMRGVSEFLLSLAVLPGVVLPNLYGMLASSFRQLSRLCYIQKDLDLALYELEV
jgi:hypothetical protein